MKIQRINLTLYCLVTLLPFTSCSLDEKSHDMRTTVDSHGVSLDSALSELNTTLGILYTDTKTLAAKSTSNISEIITVTYDDFINPTFFEHCLPLSQLYDAETDEIYLGVNHTNGTHVATILNYVITSIQLYEDPDFSTPDMWPGTGDGYYISKIFNTRDGAVYYDEEDSGTHNMNTKYTWWYRIITY